MTTKHISQDTFGGFFFQRSDLLFVSCEANLEKAQFLLRDDHGFHRMRRGAPIFFRDAKVYEEALLENLRDALELHFKPPVATLAPQVRTVEIEVAA